MNRRYVQPSQVMQSNPQMVAQPITPTAQAAPMMAPQNIQINPCTPWESEHIIEQKPNINGSKFPPYFRPSVSILPANNTVAENAGIPLNLVVHPSLVANVPVLNYSQSPIPRCSKCAAYLCPYTQGSPDGRSYTCAMCKSKNVLADAASTIPIQQRPELANPVYDMIAPRQYISAPYICAAYCIVADMSAPAVKSGFTANFLSSILATIDQLDDTCRVTIVTMSNKITMFDFKNQTEFVLSDLKDPAVQYPLVQQLGEMRDQLKQVLKMLISRPPEADGHCFGSVLECLNRIMSPLGGVILAGVYGRPTYGPRVPPPRPQNASPTEADLLKLPQGEGFKFYRDVSFMLNRQSCSINLFLVSDTLADASIIGVPCGLTGGRLFYYGQNSESIAYQMHNDIFSVMTADYFYNASIRLRASDGISITRLQGTFTIQNHDLINFPILNPRASVNFEFAIQNPLSQPVIFQLAMLWTTKNHERMIRIFTFEIPISQDINQIRQSMDEASILSYYTKRAVIDCLTDGPSVALKNLKINCNKMQNKNLPFEYFPYLAHALSISPLLCPRHPLGPDGRMMAIIDFRAASIVEICLRFYPRFFAIDTHQGPFGLTTESFARGTSFLLHTFDKIYIWISQGATPEYLMDAFGVDSLANLPNEVPNTQTPENTYLQELIQQCMTISQRYLPVEVIPQGDPREAIFGEALIDDATNTHSGYATWSNDIRTAC